MGATGNFGSYLKSSGDRRRRRGRGAPAFLSILSGYAFGLMRFRGSQVLFYVFLLGLMVPIEAMIVPLYYDLRDLGLTDTYWALILPQIGASVAFGTFWMRAFFRGVPRSLVEAARIDGASSWFTLWRVLLPLARPAVLTMTVLLFMWTWNEFLLALVMVSDEGLRTAPLGLSFFQGRNTSNLTLLAAGAVIVATAGRDRLRVPAAALHPRHADRGGEGLMAEVRFDGRRQALRRRSQAVRELSLEIADGEFMVLVGPSGSGKTTALRMLAGLESMTSRARSDRRPRGQPGRAARARHRDGLPGLRAVPADDGVRQPRVRAAAAQGAARGDPAARATRRRGVLDIGRCWSASRGSCRAGRRSGSRSGRALVREPQVFLMDEPLSNLDAKLRTQTRGEIRRLQQEVGTTTVYVTHDQVEAMTMGDRIAVMNDGVLEQVGHAGGALRAAGEPLRRRASSASPAMSVLRSRRRPSAWTGCTAEAVVGVRPEHARRWRDGPDRPADAARVAFVEALGRETFVGVDVGGVAAGRVRGGPDVGRRSATRSSSSGWCARACATSTRTGARRRSRSRRGR